MEKHFWMKMLNLMAGTTYKNKSSSYPEPNILKMSLLKEKNIKLREN